MDKDLLHPVITECRVFKSPMEMDVMRYSAKISCDAHKKVMKELKVGLRVRKMFKLFGYAEFVRNVGLLQCPGGCDDDCDSHTYKKTPLPGAASSAYLVYLSPLGIYHHVSC